MNLSCKAMLVYGEDFQNDPDFKARLTDFWCLRTAKGQGPDGDDVSLEMCTNTGRECFQEY